MGDNSSCVAAGGTVTCTLTGTTLSLAVLVADQTFSGSVPITVTDAGGRSLTLAPIRVVATPAAVTLSELGVSGPLVAGGTGELTVTVTNTGGRPTTEQPITVTLPTGITTGDPGPSDAVTCTDGVCTLLPVAPGTDSAVTVTIPITIAPSVPADPGEATVAVGENSTEPVTLTVATGVASLIADRTDVTAGTTTALVVTATPKDGVETLGPITIHSDTDGVGFPRNESCAPPPAGRAPSTVICSDPTFTLNIKVKADVPAGELKISATDAGGRSIDLTGPGGKPLQILAPPAALELSIIGVTQDLTGGGTGTVALTVSNTGGQPAIGNAISAQLPTGVGLRSVTVNKVAVCKAAEPCTLPELEPGSAADVVLALTVQPTAATGPSDLRIDVGKVSAATTVTVQSGVTALVAKPAGPFVANGKQVAVTLTPTLRTGVTTAGPITLTPIRCGHPDPYRFLPDSRSRADLLGRLVLGDHGRRHRAVGRSVAGHCHRRRRPGRPADHLRRG